MINRPTLHRLVAEKMATWGDEVEAALAQCGSLLQALRIDSHLQAQVSQLVKRQSMLLDDDFFAPPVPIVPEKYYTVIGIDGSQIFPDHHEGISWYLTHVAACTLAYQKEGSFANIHTDPQLYTESGSRETVSWQRAFNEILMADAMAAKMKDAIILFDGPILPSSVPSEKIPAMQQLCRTLEKNQSPIIGYVTCPQSVYLHDIALLTARASGIDFVPKEEVRDAQLISFWIPDGHRSSCGREGGMIRRVWFFMRVGDECARVEFPEYLLHTYSVDHIAAIVADQIYKGFGYPIVLAEAHAQAVVSEHDRRFFYQTIHNLAPKQRGHGVSHKLQRKRKIPL